MHFFIINTNHIHVFFCKNTKKNRKKPFLSKKTISLQKKEYEILGYYYQLQ